MSARQKLNGAYVNGSLFLAIIAGWVAESWLVFFLVLFVLLGLNLSLGEIRPTNTGRHGRRGR
jgi:hypothetical protein